MKARALSNFSGSESAGCYITGDINVTYTRLRAIISEEANVRKMLAVLFVKQKEEASEALRRAQQHVALVNVEQAKMQEVLRKETESANATEGAVLSGLQDVLGEPPNIAAIEERRATETGEAFQEQRKMNMLGETEAPTRNPARSVLGLVEGLCRTPARSMHGLYPPEGAEGSLNRPLQGPYEQPSKSPARSVLGLGDEPPRSPACSSRELEDAYSLPFSVLGSPKSPARSICVRDAPPRSPIRSIRQIEDPSPSPTRSNHGHENAYLSAGTTSTVPKSPAKPALLFGGNYGGGTAAGGSSARGDIDLTMSTPSFGGGGFGSFETSWTAVLGGGLTSWGFGACPPPPPPKFGYGAATLSNGGFGFGLGPTLQPTSDADAEDRALMEQKRQKEEDELAEELKQLEAEEAEQSERDRLEEARQAAEQLEQERLDREREDSDLEVNRQELERQRIEQEVIVAEERARHERELAERARRLAFQEASTVVGVAIRKLRDSQQELRRIDGPLVFSSWQHKVTVRYQEEIVDECVGAILEALRLEVEKPTEE